MRPDALLWMSAPFAALLAAIALGPVCFAEWWSRHYGKVSLGLGALAIALYLGLVHDGGRVVHTGIEYLSFISLMGSLFVVSGGIHIHVKGEATPAANVLFLLVGAVLSNLLGVTGASMLLIRPWLRMNRYRLTAHHVVFFIFILSNVGGSLTPIGNAPLFLGYLEGVPFLWVLERCWPMALTGTGILLVMFYFVDAANFRRAPAPARVEETGRGEPRFQGLRNLVFLLIVPCALFIHRPPFLREILLLAVAAGSYFMTPRAVHESNDFNFHPVREVAILFAGIFATMIPALDWLGAHAAHLGNPSPGLFYWGSGALSSVLDNAPTYLGFFNAGAGTFAPPDSVSALMDYIKAHGASLGPLGASMAHAGEIRAAIAVLQQYHPHQLAAGTVTPEEARVALMLANPTGVRCLQAISMGSVFFGANTYIGNGPNFMVKAIANQQQVRTPTFPGYILKFTLPFMLPMLLIVWWIFF